MSSSLPQPLILSVFHCVVTDVPQSGRSSGQFIIGKDSECIFFKWTPDICPKEPPSPDANDDKPNKFKTRSTFRSQIKYIHQIYLTSNRIQRIIITPQISSIVISTLNPSEMHQFTFSVNSIPYTLQLLQILAVNSALAHNPVVVEDFWRNTTLNNGNIYPSSSNVSKVYDIACENGEFIVPYIPVASFESISLVDEMSQNAISARFNINGPLFERSPVTMEFYKTIIGTTIKLSDIRLQVSRKGIERNLRALLWPQLLGVLPFEKDVSHAKRLRVIDYNNLKSQWQSLTSYQLAKRHELRSAFQTIRMDVRRTNVPPPFDELRIKESLINILKTYTIFNYNIRYTQGLNDIALPFVIVLIDKIEDYEAIAFWCFASFVERICSPLIEDNMDNLMNKDLPHVFQIISENDTRCSEWLSSYEMNDLNFLVSSYMLGYRRSLEEETLERLWDSTIASENPHHFMMCYSAALIIYSYPSFSKIEKCSTSHILQICDKIFSQLSIGAVVGLALMMESESKQIERRMQFRSEASFKYDYFQPMFNENHKFYLKSNLFA
ncbi:TBC domain containing protein [Histomonas meleagridis]|uniref:TBC domain containing protein n=1 Tax=Histomonas meleagridis TaxID=135588 RepID=UPI003559DAD6|nr:TBC domain containing protein [Histomonas meleagridis]KAH0804268.1 TBC domain containing protein [Histomonas meleagridis]